jgi:hypothetical protein
MEIYERQLQETSMAWEAAQTYFNMGSERSLAAVAQKLDKSITIIGRWSGRWNWAARARAWDDTRDREIAAAVAKAMTAEAIKVAADWKMRENALRQESYDFGSVAVAKLRKMMEFPLATVTTKTVELAGGMARVTTVLPAKWTFDTIARVGNFAFPLMERAVRNTGSVNGDEMEREENWMIEDYVVPEAVPGAAPAEGAPNPVPTTDKPPDK